MRRRLVSKWLTVLAASVLATSGVPTRVAIAASVENTDAIGEIPSTFAFGRAPYSQTLVVSQVDAATSNYSQQDLRTGQYVSFANMSQPSFTGFDSLPGGAGFYGVTRSDATLNPSTLGFVNESTGQFSAISPIGGIGTQGPQGFTINPRTGEAFLQTYLSGINYLYRINLSTGAATFVGQIGAPNPTVIVSISMDCRGLLFGLDLQANAIYMINTTTAAAYMIGTVGRDISFDQGMEFDNDTGQLYANLLLAGDPTVREFGIISTQNASFQLIANHFYGTANATIPTDCPSNVILKNGFEETFRPE